MIPSTPRPQRLRIESAEQPANILKDILISSGFVFFGLFALNNMRPGDSRWGAWLCIAIGSGWILYCLRIGYSRYKFGSAYLEVDMPVRLGQKMSARLVIPSIVSAKNMAADLTCRHVHWERDARRRARAVRGLTESVLWSKQAQFPIMKQGGASEGQISFELPTDKPVSDQPAGPDDQLRPGHYWELKIDIAVPGVNFVRRFRFPVVN